MYNIINILNNIASYSFTEKKKVGCLALNNNKIITTGYNHYLKDSIQKSIIIDNHDISTIHAEQDLLINCINKNISLKDADIYITHFPCLNCIKLLYSANIKNIYYI